MIMGYGAYEQMEKGFSLIEIVVVVAIIAILSVLSFGYYMRSKEKALAKDLVTLARGCMVDVFSECVAQNGDVDVEHKIFLGCGNRTLGNLGNVEIRPEGCCTNFTVEAISTKLGHYKGRCTGDYRDKLECEIAKR